MHVQAFGAAVICCMMKVFDGVGRGGALLDGVWCGGHLCCCAWMRGCVHMLSAVAMVVVVVAVAVVSSGCSLNAPP